MYTLPQADLMDIHRRVKDFWPRKQAVLLTGGTGFFGRWLVESIAEIEEQEASGNIFYLVTRQDADEIRNKIPALQRESVFKIVNADLEQGLLADFHLDYVIHAASDVAAVKNNMQGVSSSADGTRNLLHALQKQNSLKKILYVSSGGVYGKAVDESARESDELWPSSNTYSQTKLQSENLVTEFAQESKVEVCLVRCFSFVGPYADSKMAVMQMIAKHIRGESIEIHSPETKRSFMYPTDLVVGLLTLLFKKTQQVIYNLGSNEAVTLQDVAKKISHFSLQPAPVKIISNAGSAGLAGKYYYPDITRLQSEFKDILSVPLEKALQKTIQFEKERNKI